MKKILLLLFSAMLLSQLNFGQNEINYCAAAKIMHAEQNSVLSKVNYPGDNSIDIQYYKLDIELFPSENKIAGRTNIDLLSEVDNLSEFYLDFNDGMTLKSVNLNGTEAVYTHTDDKINIQLDRNYFKDELISVEITYEGNPEATGFGSFAFSSISSTPVVWSLSEPYGASDWFPCKDTPKDKADSSDVWVTCDENLTAVSNGTLKEVLENGDGTKTYKWKNNYPIAQYLISIAVTDYDEYFDYYHYSDTDSMLVAHYIYPGRLSSYKSNLDKTVNMLEIFSGKFGEFPFLEEKYGHAEFGWGGGMEHQTISSMGSFGEGIIAHELGHQWFGDKITCEDWHHIWLNEGFATYCEGVYYEETYGKSRYNSFIVNEMNYAKSARGSIYVENINSVNEIFNSARSYSKGGVVLHMLRGTLGDETFFNVLQAYLTDPELAYNVATTEDFQRVAEEVSGQDLEYFFNEWIYGESFPSYLFGWQSEKIDNYYRISISVDQNERSNPLYFVMPIDFKIETAEGDTTVTFFNEQKTETFTVEVSSLPTKVTFDPENKILKSLNTITSVNNTIVDKFSLEQNYPNPFNPSTLIEYSVSKPSKITLKIFDVIGSEVAVLINEQKDAGIYQVEFNPNEMGLNLSSGIYIYQLSADNYINSKKMVLLK